jgi:hypothetical protein
VTLSRRARASVRRPHAADPQPRALDQLIHAPSQDAAHVRLLHDGQKRLLGAPARLQEAREIAALPDLWDLQLDADLGMHPETLRKKVRQA